jgi:hypothetical protein
VDVRLPLSLSLSLSLSCSCYLFFLLLLPPTKPTDRRPPSFLTLDQGRQFDMTNQCQVIYPCCYSIRKEHWKKCTNSCFCQPWASCVAHATCCCCFPHRQWRRLPLLSIGIICLSLFLSPSLFRAYPLSFSLSLCYCSVLCAFPLSLSLSLCIPNRSAGARPPVRKASLLFLLGETETISCTTTKCCRQAKDDASRLRRGGKNVRYSLNKNWIVQRPGAIRSEEGTASLKFVL